MFCVPYCRLVAARPNAATKSRNRLFHISRQIPSIPFHCLHRLGKRETIQVIVNALVEEDYELARGLTELHLGFFMHRRFISPAQPQARQDAPLPEASQPPENFPPVYHDLALAHQAAAEELARIIPTRDMKQILPQLNNVLKACVACHLEFTVREQS